MKSNKLHFKSSENGVYAIKNLTGVGPEDLNEIVISLTNRDMYTSRSRDELNSKYGFLYISGFQGNKIINDFYKIIFEDKETVDKIIKEYAES